MDHQRWIFQPFPWFFLSSECQSIISSLQTLQLPDTLLYLRGSIVEELKPHPNADIDLILIGSTVPLPKLERHFYGILDLSTFFVLHQHKFSHNPIQLLLLSTRSIPVFGPRFPMYQIAADRNMAKKYGNTTVPVHFCNTENRFQRCRCTTKF